MSTHSTESTRKLRQRAEEKVALIGATNSEKLTPVDIQRLLHEMQVHQVELEMQNEELRRAIAEKDALQALVGTYSDLYEFAPAGYFNLDHDATIHAVNMTGAELLGVERALLINNRLDAFISNETRPMFHSFLDKVFTSGAKETCEVTFVTERRSTLFVQIDAIVTDSGKNCRAVIIDITERKQSEKNRAALAAIVESTEDAVIGEYLDGTITSWNSGAEHLYGYQADEMIGQSIIRIFPPELQVEETDILDRVNQGKPISHYETERLAKDGRRISVSLTVSPIRDASGIIIGASKITRDITERKQAETFRSMGQDILLVMSEYINQKEAIKRVIDIIKSATSVDAVGIRLQDGDDFPYFYQEGFPEDFLLKENSILTRTKDGGICRDECGEICLECTCGLVVTSKTDPSSPLFTKGGSSWTNDSFPFLHVQADDDIRTNPRNECIHQGFASVALIPIRAKGRVVGLLQLNDRRKGCFTLEGIETLEKIAENIGESMLRKQAEEALRESETKYRELVQNANSVIIRWRCDGTLVFFNEYAQSLFGYGADEIIGRDVRILVPEKESTGGDLTELIQNIVTNPANYMNNVNENVCRDGHRIWLAWTNKPIFDEQGRVAEILAVGVDITERKLTEDILRFLGQCGSTESGEYFFHDLARYLASTLDMDFVCIDQLEDDRLSAETLAVFHNGQFEDNVSYTLNDTPCGDVVGKNICSFPKNVCGLFPKDEVLQDLQAESYLGTTLWSSQGKPIGLIAVNGRQPLEDTRLGESVLQLVAVRAAGELERMQAEDELRKLHAELETRVKARTDELATSIETLQKEIAERAKAEQSLFRLNRLYAVLSETNQSIVKVTDRNILFSEFCRIAVEHGGFLLSWVGLVDEASGEVRRIAACGKTAYLDDIRITAAEEPEGEGPTGITIRHGTYCICNDFQNDPCTRPWHERGKVYGINSSAGVAMKEGNRVIGVLTLYSGEKNYFDKQQVELLLQMGMDISFALDNLNREEHRKNAEQALYLEATERLKIVEALREKEQLLIQQSRQAAMGEMIGNIAHQWRQPLNILGLYTQKLGIFYGSPSFNKEFLDNSIAKSMEIIKHMSKTIDDFRDYFKPENEKADFYVIETIKNTLSLLEGNFNNPKIAIDLVEHDNPVIRGYQNEFAQVLLNILNNARDAIIEREIADARVTIMICSENNCAVVTVADNAGGIPDEVIKKVFDPYFTTKGPQIGTGIGLFMSKTIIEKNMGGKLTVRNTDTGAEFRIEVEQGTQN